MEQRGSRRCIWILAGVLIAALAGERRALAYEFEVQARTIGQGAELRSFRLLGRDLLLDRRLFTQMLSLNLYDLGNLRGPRRWHRLYERYRADRPQVSAFLYLRIDHDFGAWSSGELIDGGRIYDAVDLIPELEARLLRLDLVHAYVQAERLWHGRMDVRVGRQVHTGTLDWWAMDGVWSALRQAWGPGLFTMEIFAGTRVRDSSPAAAANTEPDGTSAAECREYVEGPTPGSGAWRPIDRQPPTDERRYRNDYDRCPQREELMPTFGGAVIAEWLQPRSYWRLRLDYRRSISKRPGLLGARDRFDYPDTGYYPNERGDLPDWGRNEEHAALSLRGNWSAKGRRMQLTPYAGLRYGMLLGMVEEAHLGTRARHGAHNIEPEIYYSMPSFDGDSIFNVFTAYPYWDARMTYIWQPPPRTSQKAQSAAATSAAGRGGPGAGLRMHAFVRGWGRYFATEAANGPAEQGAGGESSGGVQLGGGLGRERRWSTRMELFHEDGYGGRRTGGHGAGTWQMSAATKLRARLSVVNFAGTATPFVAASGAEDASGSTSYGLQLGASYRMDAGIVLHVVAEENYNAYYRGQLRVLGVIDLAFVPEL